MKSISDQIKKMDLYGLPIALNFKGSSVFQTTLGGLLSIHSVLLILAFAVVKGTSMVHRSNPTITQVT